MSDSEEQVEEQSRSSNDNRDMSDMDVSIDGAHPLLA